MSDTQNMILKAFDELGHDKLFRYGAISRFISNRFKVELSPQGLTSKLMALERRKRL